MYYSVSEIIRVYIRFSFLLFIIPAMYYLFKDISLKAFNEIYVDENGCLKNFFQYNKIANYISDNSRSIGGFIFIALFYIIFIHNIHIFIYIIRYVKISKKENFIDKMGNLIIFTISILIVFVFVFLLSIVAR